MLLLRYSIIFCVALEISLQRPDKQQRNKGCAKRKQGLCKSTGRKKASKGRCKCDLSCVTLRDCCDDFYQLCQGKLQCCDDFYQLCQGNETGIKPTKPSGTPLSRASTISNTKTTRSVPKVRKSTTTKSNRKSRTTSSTLQPFYTTELGSLPPSPSNTTRDESATTQQTWVTERKQVNTDGHKSTITPTITISADVTDDDMKVTQTAKRFNMTTSYISVQNSSTNAVFRVTTKSSNFDTDEDRHIDANSDRNIDIDAGARSNSTSKIFQDNATYSTIATHVSTKDFPEKTTALTQLEPMKPKTGITKGYQKAQIHNGDKEGLDEKYVIMIGVFSTTAIIILIASVSCFFVWKKKKRRRQGDRKDVEYKLANKEKLELSSDDRFLS